MNKRAFGVSHENSDRHNRLPHNIAKISELHLVVR